MANTRKRFNVLNKQKRTVEQLTNAFWSNYSNITGFDLSEQLALFLSPSNAENDNSFIKDEGSNAINATAYSGKALSFDGTNDFVDTGKSLTFDRTDTFEFEGWVYFNSTTNGVILSQRDNSLSNKGFYIYTFSEKLTFSLHYTASNRLIIFTDEKVLIDKWQHIKITYNGNGLASGVEFYINGVLKNKDNPAQNNLENNSIQTSKNVLFGKQDIVGSELFFDGKISNPKITVNGQVVRDYKNLKGIGDSNIWFDAGSDKAHATVNGATVETGLSGLENGETHNGIPQSANEEFNTFSQLDGSTNYIECDPNDFDPNADNQVIELKFRFNAVNKTLFAYRDYLTTNASGVFLFVSGNTIRFFVRDTSGVNYIADINYNISAYGRYAQIIITYNGILKTASINLVGIESKNISGFGNVAVQSKMTIGAVYNGTIPGYTAHYPTTFFQAKINNFDYTFSPIFGNPITTKVCAPEDLSNLGFDIFGNTIQHSIKDSLGNQIKWNFDGESWIDTNWVRDKDRNSPFTILLAGEKFVNNVNQAFFGNLDNSNSYRGIEILASDASNNTYLQVTSSSPSNDLLKRYPNQSLGLNIRILLASYDGTSLAGGLRLYNNGILSTPNLTRNNLTQTIVNSKSFLIGKRHDNLVYLEGQLSQIQFFEKDLSSKASKKYQELFDILNA